MTYEPTTPSFNLSGRSYSKNPPGVSLTPNPLSESEFKSKLEKSKGRERALKVELQDEKNRQTGWLLAIEREKTTGLNFKHQQEGQRTQIERHRFDALKIDAKTEKGKIEHARLRGKIADTDKAIIETELGTKKDNLKSAQDFRKVNQERNKIALKAQKLDVKALQAQFDDRLAELRGLGHKITGV